MHESGTPSKPAKYGNTVSSELFETTAKQSHNGDLREIRRLFELHIDNHKRSGNVDSEDNLPSTIRISIPKGHRPYLLFMIDKGPSVNLIKTRALDYDTPVERCGSTNLGGITLATLISLGTVMITIKGTPYKFHVVVNTFPFFEDGLIERNLLWDQEAIAF